MFAIVMGVSGCGKSTVGVALAARLGWPFIDGDDLHPAANVAKMAAGEPLTDADRRPWLAAIRARLDALGADGDAVVACSALRRSYRDVLRDGPGEVRFVYLEVAADELQTRLVRRHGHFMPAGLLHSQLQTLEPPGADEHAISVVVGAGVRVGDVVSEIVDQLAR